MQTNQSFFDLRDLETVQKTVLATPPTVVDGAQYLSELLGPVDCVRYSDIGIVFEPAGRTIVAPAPNEVLLLVTSVSLCGTDLALIDKAQHGKLPPETQRKIVGHEAAGVIVGVGSAVTNWNIGQIVNLDSHFACEQGEHHSFEDCVASGLSCDGIAGGIRGAMGEDGKTRHQPIDGYWSRVLQVPASALPVEMPLAVAQSLKAPSTLESLGNIYMIVEQLDALKMMDAPEQTLCVVSGLGATGYPMAAVATQYGQTVIGINPSAGKREFALKQGACSAAYATMAEAAPHVAGKTQVIVVVTAGDEGAYADALAFLDGLDASITRKVLIAFGLFEDAAKPLPGTPTDLKNAAGAPLPQRDFVFSRHHFVTAQKTEVYGVCGRNLAAWRRLMTDLTPKAGETTTHLAQMLNEAQVQVSGADPLAQIATELNQGAGHVKQLLAEHHGLKLVANLLTAQN